MPWITLIQPQPDNSHLMYYLWKITEKHYHTLKKHYLQLCSYQFHQFHLHLYRYLCIHLLIADEQFLLLIDVPIQNHKKQPEIYEVFNLSILHRNFSLEWNPAPPLGQYHFINPFINSTNKWSAAMDLSTHLDQLMSH